MTCPAHARPSPGQPRLRPGPAVESPHYAPAHSSECIEETSPTKSWRITYKTSNVPISRRSRSQERCGCSPSLRTALFIPFAECPTGLVPTPLRHALSCLRRQAGRECAAGNNPLKTAANNLAKLATSPLPPRFHPYSMPVYPGARKRPRQPRRPPSSPSAPSAPLSGFAGMMQELLTGRIRRVETLLPSHVG